MGLARFSVVAVLALALPSLPVCGQQQDIHGETSEVPGAGTPLGPDGESESPQLGLSRRSHVMVRDLYLEVGQSAGITVVFDRQLRDQRTDIDIEGLSPDVAFDTIARSAGHFITRVNPTTIMVAEDTPQNRREYERLAVRLFVLENASAKEADVALRSLIEARRLVAIDRTNSILMRATEDKLEIADRIIRRIDRPLGEVEVNARILHVDASTMARVLKELGLGPETGQPLRFEAARARQFEEHCDASLLVESTVGLVGHQESSVRIDQAGGVSATLELGAHVHPEEREVTINSKVNVETQGKLDEGSRPRFAKLVVQSTARVKSGTTLLITGALTGNDDEASPESLVVVALTPTLVRVPEYDPDDLAPIFVGTEAHIGFDQASDPS